jgi:hypothetical protein
MRAFPSYLLCVSTAVFHAYGADAGVQPWPGSQDVSDGDEKNEFDENMSDTVSMSHDTCWAVQNRPSTLYHLSLNSKTIWEKSGSYVMLYPDGSTDPDTEDVAMTQEPDVVYVSVEESNVKEVSQPGILRFDVSSPHSPLKATHFWDLTALLPKADANKGLEGLAWVSDDFLTANHFYDDTAKAAYDPADYPTHGDGLFFVGLESTGDIYAVALDMDIDMKQSEGEGGGTNAWVVQTIAGELASIMSLEFDASTGYLYGGCDSHCEGNMAVYAPNKDGRMVAVAVFAPPTGLKASQNIEGSAIAKDQRRRRRLSGLSGDSGAMHSGSSSGGGSNGGSVKGSSASSTHKSTYKGVLWTDDDCTDGHALYEGTIPEGDFLNLSLVV